MKTLLLGCFAAVTLALVAFVVAGSLGSDQVTAGIVGGAAALAAAMGILGNEKTHFDTVGTFIAGLFAAAAAGAFAALATFAAAAVMMAIAALGSSVVASFSVCGAKKQGIKRQWVVAALGLVAVTVFVGIAWPVPWFAIVCAGAVILVVGAVNRQPDSFAATR
ncbi:MAG: hypothetical protein PHT12_05805 [Patescibacteria group bacterium]|nr:hypothetical protein [Patescibacteria group bacterium]